MTNNNSSFKKIATSAAVIASILVAQAGPLASAATAGGRNDSFSGERSFRHDNGNHDDFRGLRDGRGGRHNSFGYRRGGHSDHSGRNIAIGLSALALAAILAAQGHRNH
ncbi:MAG: hypothetical protein WC807_02325 [Hyphomicrobium sp.]|jgi:hypothetical protein